MKSKNPASEIIFVLPEDASMPSGGNLYNYFLLKALKEEGFVFQTMDIDQALNHMYKNFPSIYWVDSLYLDRAKDLLKQKKSHQNIFFIIHHLPSLEPDLSREDAAEKKSKEQDILNNMTGFLVTSSYTKKILLRRKIDDKPCFVVPPALCLAPSSGKRAADNFRGLIVSNLVQRKGILEFLESLGKKISNEDGFEIRIAGRFDIEPKYAKSCQREVERNSLLKKHIDFVGPVAIAKMRDLYTKSTVFISSSKMETFGMAIREAKAFGLPVLAYKAQYIKRLIVPGKNGYLYSSIPDLAQGCLGLIRKPQRLRNISKLASLNRDEESYSWRDAAKLFLEQFLSWQGDKKSRISS